MPVFIGLGVVVLLAAGIALWIRRTFVAITVEGSSMTPTLAPGDRVLIRRGRRGLRRDRIVVIREPDPIRGWRRAAPAGRDLRASGWYIKRLVAMPGDPMPDRVVGFGDVVPDGHIVVIGDHPFSGDSKHHGPCPVDQVLGVVVRQMERAPNAGDSPPPVFPPEGFDVEGARVVREGRVNGAERPLPRPPGEDRVAGEG